MGEFLTVIQRNSHKKRMKHREFQEILSLKENHERTEFVIVETI